ncbi:MAG: hypothetical protein K9K21_12040 [Desulfotignum sp.]|nr:hypothetical protein [Desulfotignum sp.]MCF8114570.1 hypothetical protein [Desulfotignum sp.]
MEIKFVTDISGNKTAAIDPFKEETDEYSIGRHHHADFLVFIHHPSL